MATTTEFPLRPKVSRQVSRVPGGFEDTDDEFSPANVDSGQDESKEDHANASAVDQDNSIFTASSEIGGIPLPEEASTLEEREIRKQLMDEDSTFLPPLSPFAGSGRYDTLTSGASQSSPQTVTGPSKHNRQLSTDNSIESIENQSEVRFAENESSMMSPDSPSGIYQTPAPGHSVSPQASMSSSPTAQAAARRPSRSASMASMEGYKTADDEKPPSKAKDLASTDEEETPRKLQSRKPTTTPDTETPTPKLAATEELDDGANGDTESADLDSTQSRKRPKFFSNRVATQTSSYSTYTTTSTQADSDATLGADYALQTGGAAPFGSSINSRPRMDYSRTTSLGSMASGISGLSDDARGHRNGVDEGMQTLSEEGPSTGKEDGSWAPSTPRVVSSSTDIPTDTVLAQRVKDVEVPAAAAREYRDRHKSPSPDKRPGAPTASINRNGRNLTLKEQSGTIDRLTKENFDLKMKITFLNDSLNKRSPEGVASLVNENADLKAAKVTSAKEIRELKRSIRDLERTLRIKEGELDEIVRASRKEANAGVTGDHDKSSLEEELIVLKDRIVSYDVEIEKVRHERYEQKRETDKLARLLDVRRTHGSDAAVLEEIVSHVRNLYTSRNVADKPIRTCGRNSASLKQYVVSRLMRRINDFEKNYGGLRMAPLRRMDINKIGIRISTLQRSLVGPYMRLQSSSNTKMIIFDVKWPLKLPC